MTRDECKRELRGRFGLAEGVVPSGALLGAVLDRKEERALMDLAKDATASQLAVIRTNAERAQLAGQDALAATQEDFSNLTDALKRLETDGLALLDSPEVKARAKSPTGALRAQQRILKQLLAMRSEVAKTAKEVFSMPENQAILVGKGGIVVGGDLKVGRFDSGDPESDLARFSKAKAASAEVVSPE